MGTISEEVLTKVQLEGDIAKPEPQSCNVSHVDNGRSVEIDKAHSGHSNSVNTGYKCGKRGEKPKVKDAERDRRNST